MNKLRSWCIFVMVVAIVGLQPAPTHAEDPILAAAGDIANCNQQFDEATAKLLDSMPSAVVLPLGDNAYAGTAASYADCYNPTWGRHKARTRPTPGNHEYRIAGATPYFDYFGAAAGERGKGYYSFNVGAWHVVVLNNYVDMATGSAQERWLRADLAANPTTCTLATWHEPRWTSGTGHPNNMRAQPLYQALYDYGADILLSGHEHHYERFAPQDPNGTLDNARGIRQFIVGTGGHGMYGFGTPIPNSEVRSYAAFGVLKLTLHATSYDWNFTPVAGSRFTDYGRKTCSPATKPTASQVTFTAHADARVAQAAPAVASGNSTRLRVNGGAEPSEETFLRFSVSGITRPVVSAKIRVYAISDTASGPSLYRTPFNWTEATLTWNTRPERVTSVLATQRVIPTNTWAEYDVSTVVKANGTYSFVLAGTSTDGVDFSSREGTNPPQLVVTMAAP